MIESTIIEQTQPQEPHRIYFDPYDGKIGSMLNKTLELANIANLKIRIDENASELPGYQHDCVWSIRHKKSRLTDVKIKLKALESQTRYNSGDELVIGLFL